MTDHQKWLVARHRCDEGATAYTQTVKRQPKQRTVFHDLVTGYEIGKYRKLFSDDTSRELDASDQVELKISMRSIA